MYLCSVFKESSNKNTEKIDDEEKVGNNGEKNIENLEETE